MQHFPRSLRASFWDIAFFSLMVGLGETYIAAFALSMGLSVQNSGMIATLPILLASILQIGANAGVKRLGSRRKWVMLCAITQALSLLCLAGLARWHPPSQQLKETILFLCVTIYWTCALSAAPSWNSWIASIIPDPMRTPFFAIRARISQCGTVVGLAATGFFLQGVAVGEDRLQVFGIVFLTSAVCRFTSAFFISRTVDSSERISGRGLGDLLKREGFSWLCERRTGVLVLFLVTTNFAVHISSPYFNAYMLRQLHLDYVDYMLLISASFIARVLTGGWLQRLAMQYGASSLTHLGAFLVIFTPILWVFSDAYPYMLLLQVFTGIAWGCHELGVTLMLLENQSHDERARLLTLTNLLNSSAMFLGSSLGYSLLAYQSLEARHYYVVFTLSTAFRFIPFFILSLLGDSRIRLKNIPRQIAFGGRRFFRSSP